MKAKQFRKRPVVIEAIQFTEELALHALNTREPIFGSLMVCGSWHPGNQQLGIVYVGIDTLEGLMKASLNDWIIKGVKGELYPCKPDVFAATYEEVSE